MSTVAHAFTISLNRLDTSTPCDITLDRTEREMGVEEVQQHIFALCVSEGNVEKVLNYLQCPKSQRDAIKPYALDPQWFILRQEHRSLHEYECTSDT